MKLTFDMEKEIIDLYVKDLLACGDIAKKYGVSRTCIWKVLRRNNIDTRKRKFLARCHLCNRRIYRNRCQIKKSVHLFCSTKCYHKYLRRNEYNEWRYEQKIARKQIEKVIFNIPPEAVVHHIDGDCRNNELSNLMLFKNQADRLRFHREIPGVKPIWPEV